MKLDPATALAASVRVAAAAAACFAATPAAATGGFFSVPPTIRWQARLVDGAGLPLLGVHTAEFRLYAGGTPGAAGSGVQVLATTASLVAEEGVVSASIGIPNGYPLSPLDFGQPVHLEVAIDGGAPILPRARLESVPFALRAEVAGRALSADAATTAGFADSAASAVSAATAVRAGDAERAGRALQAVALVDPAAETTVAEALAGGAVSLGGRGGRFRIADGTPADQSAGPAAGNTSSTAFGQSFTAGVTGRLGSIRLQLDGPPGQPSIPGLFALTPAAGAAIAFPVSVPSSGPVVVEFPSPVGVTAGDQYSWDLTTPSNVVLALNPANPYPGGSATIGGTPAPNVDLVFTTYVTAPAVAMVLDGPGNLGVGTTSPAERLHVAGGGIRVDGPLAVGGTARFDQPFNGQAGVFTAFRQGYSDNKLFNTSFDDIPGTSITLEVPAGTMVVQWSAQTRCRTNAGLTLMLVRPVVGGFPVDTVLPVVQGAIGAGTPINLSGTFSVPIPTARAVTLRLQGSIGSGANLYETITNTTTYSYMVTVYRQ